MQPKVPLQESARGLEPEERLVLDALRKARRQGCDYERAYGQGETCANACSWDDFCVSCMAEVALHDWGGG